MLKPTSGNKKETVILHEARISDVISVLPYMWLSNMFGKKILR